MKLALFLLGFICYQTAEMASIPAAKLEISKRQAAGGLSCDCSDDKYDTDTNTSFETSFERDCWTDCQDDDRTKRDDAAARLEISKRQTAGGRTCDCSDDKYDADITSMETSFERECWTDCQDEDRTKRDDAAARLEISKRQTAGGRTCDCSDDKYDADITSMETSFERECWTDCQEEDRTKRDDAAARLEISKRQTAGGRTCDCSDDKYDADITSMETSFERECWTDCQDEDRSKRDDAAARLEISKRQTAGGLTCDCSDEKYDTDTNTSFETSFERECWTDCQDEDRTKRDDAAAKLKISKRQARGSREDCDCDDDKYDTSTNRSFETSYERDCWNKCQL